MQGRRQGGGLGGLQPPPIFDRSVNPISTSGANYAHHSTTSPPKFSDLATGLLLIDVLTGRLMKCVIGIKRNIQLLDLQIIWDKKATGMPRKKKHGKIHREKRFVLQFCFLNILKMDHF